MPGFSPSRSLMVSKHRAALSASLNLRLGQPGVDQLPAVVVAIDKLAEIQPGQLRQQPGAFASPGVPSAASNSALIRPAEVPPMPKTDAGLLQCPGVADQRNSQHSPPSITRSDVLQPAGIGDIAVALVFQRFQPAEQRQMLIRVRGSAVLPESWLGSAQQNSALIRFYFSAVISIRMVTSMLLGEGIGNERRFRWLVVLTVAPHGAQKARHPRYVSRPALSLALSSCLPNKSALPEYCSVVVEPRFGSHKIMSELDKVACC